MSLQVEGCQTPLISPAACGVFSVLFLESGWYLGLETVFLGISALVKADVVMPWGITYLWLTL